MLSYAFSGAELVGKEALDKILIEHLMQVPRSQRAHHGIYQPARHKQFIRAIVMRGVATQ